VDTGAHGNGKCFSRSQTRSATDWKAGSDPELPVSIGLEQSPSEDYVSTPLTQPRMTEPPIEGGIT